MSEFKTRLDHAMDVEKYVRQNMLEKCDMTADEVEGGLPLGLAKADEYDLTGELSKAVGGPFEETDGLHIDRYLTNFAMEQIQNTDTYTASMITPSMSVSKRSNKYVVWNTDDFMRTGQTKRGDDEKSEGDGFKFSEDNYYCDWYSSHKKLGLIARNEQDAPIDMQRMAIAFLVRQILQQRENDWYDLFMPDLDSTTAATSTNPYNADMTYAGANNNIFSPSYTGDLIEQIISAADRQEQMSGGYRPNVLVLTRDVKSALCTNDDILARINGGATVNSPALVKNAQIAAALEVDAVYVIHAVKSTIPNTNADPSSADKLAGRKWIGNNKAMLLYRDPSLSVMSQSFGAIFNWNIAGMPVMGAGLSQYEDRARRSTIIEADQFYAMKVTGKDFVSYWPGAITATS